MYPSCASISTVTSTTVVAMATGPARPSNVAARAPMTKPPICDSGSTSEPASRMARLTTKIQGLVARCFGTITHQDSPSKHEEHEVIEADDGETAPADRQQRVGHRAEAVITHDAGAEDHSGDRGEDRGQSHDVAEAPQPQARQRHRAELGEEARAQQSFVEFLHAPCVLAVAILEEAAEGEAFEEDACLRRGEFLAVIDLRAAPRRADQALQRAVVVAQGGQAAAPG